MKDDIRINLKKARFHLNESCCSTTAKLIDIDESDEVCTNSLNELIEYNNKNKDHSKEEN